MGRLNAKKGGSGGQSGGVSRPREEKGTGAAARGGWGARKEGATARGAALGRADCACPVGVGRRGTVWGWKAASDRRCWLPVLLLRLLLSLA
jgi:hypothetical protein